MWVHNMSLQHASVSPHLFVLAQVFYCEMTKACVSIQLNKNAQWHHVRSQSGIKFKHQTPISLLSVLDWWTSSHWICHHFNDIFILGVQTQKSHFITDSSTRWMVHQHLHGKVLQSSTIQISLSQLHHGKYQLPDKTAWSRCPNVFHRLN